MPYAFKPSERGFTIIEVIIAAMIMTTVCVGTLTVFSHVVMINTGNNLRSEAQSVLQQEVEYYRGLTFSPGGADANLNSGTVTRPQRTAADGQVFNISVTIANLYPTVGAANGVATYKEIRITATPATAKSGWLADLRTSITIQRVRSN